MKLTIVLQRVGSSRVAESSIPLVARVLQGGRFGEDLLAGKGLSDMEGAKVALLAKLRNSLGRSIDVEWIDKTA
jgi:hypothetical protein